MTTPTKPLNLRPFLSTSLVAGFLGGAICVLYVWILHVAGQNPFGQFKYMYIGIYAFPFICAFKIYRDTLNNFKLKAQHAIAMGLIINITGAIVLGAIVYSWLSFSSEGAGIIERFVREASIILEQSKEGLSESFDAAHLAKLKEQLESTTAADLAFDFSGGALITGMFHTFLFTLVFKN